MSELDKINSPTDLRKLGIDNLQQVAEEMRNFIVEIVSREGGHLGASLGVIELTLALHYVFNTPDDVLIWDVGHQAYGHKIITGRRDQFHTNRKTGGISGFPEREESIYDPFGTGHSSTSISAALGMAIASQLQGNLRRNHIAVIGDGALTGGMVFEALNQAGVLDVNLLIVLNDNSMSIDENVGALKDHLAHLRGEPGSADNIFENLGITYSGPVDGHDLEALIKKLREFQYQPGPVLLHCVTKKGKGYAPAESGNAVLWHAPGVFDRYTGKVLKPEKEHERPKKFQEIFGETLLKLARENEKIVGITPAMPSGSSLNIMMNEMPHRCFDVDIAEQHAVTFSAGLAAGGMLPFCNIYSTFMQRGYDQLIHDVARQQLKVIFCLDRAGLVGEDGATHHGAYDLAYTRCIPDLIVAAPMDGEELSNMMYTAQLEEIDRPMVIRYPRGSSAIMVVPDTFQRIETGKGRQLLNGNDLAVITIGNTGTVVNELVKKMNSEENYSIAHYDLRFLKPLDEDLLRGVFQQFDKIITVEDGCINGGMGSAILEFMSDNNFRATVKRLGIPDRKIPHGSPEDLYKLCGYDSEAIRTEINRMLR